MKIHKRIITLFILVTLIISPLASYANTETNNNYTLPNISARAYYVIDNKTNKVLYKHRENEKMYPASTTKIVTAILTLEHSNLNDTVTANYESISEIPEGYASANLQVGETLTVEQLLQLLLVPSCNDVANVLAYHIGGSIDSFVSMMNTKVHELGLTSTHFTNPYGRHDENHYTTAHDLAIIFQYCLKNNTFRKISSQATCSIPATNKSPLRSYESTNKCIVPGNPNYYKHLTCGKTGLTSEAKQCLVSSSYNNNLELISVILGSDNRFQDTRRLYMSAYSNYSIHDIIKKDTKLSSVTIQNGTKETKNLDLLASNNIQVLLNNNINTNDLPHKIEIKPNIKAPINTNDIIGKVTYTIDNTEYTCNLIASHDVEKSNYGNYILYGCSFLIISFILYELFHIIYTSIEKNDIESDDDENDENIENNIDIENNNKNNDENKNN